MTRLLLLRHGQAQVNVEGRLSSRAPGAPLTDHGRRQARDAAARLGAGVVAVYTSPLLRARQTAEIVADALSPDPPVGGSCAAPSGRPGSVADAPWCNQTTLAPAPGQPTRLVPLATPPTGGSGLSVRLTLSDLLAEVGIGELEGRRGSDDTVLRHPVFQAWQGGQDLDRPLAGGETGTALVARMAVLLDLVRSRHPDETVLAVTHGGLLAAAVPNLATGVPLDRARAQIPLNTAVVELVHDGASGPWVCRSWPAVVPGRTAQHPPLEPAAGPPSEAGRG